MQSLIGRQLSLFGFSVSRVWSLTIAGKRLLRGAKLFLCDCKIIPAAFQTGDYGTCIDGIATR
ncbi:MAG: hypothetical protein CL724_06845 [Chloroflexi bacterium]|nr:hypothetical protein [Chloroflexota bacterium]